MTDSRNLVKNSEQPKNASMNKKYLFMMLGHSGSGKSYFVRQLVKEIQLVRLNSDTLRMEMYGSVEELERYKAMDLTLSREKIFNALGYAVKQVLDAGFSVILDSNNNKRSIRHDSEGVATEYGATPIVIWIQTSPDIAIKRGQERIAASDSRQFNEKKAREVVERHIANTDEPGGDEKLIKIDGTASFEQQYASFQDQLSSIT